MEMNKLKELTPEEAASYITNGMTVGFSGFTPAGAAKIVPKAIAKIAKEEHNSGREFKIGVITGASTGDSLDGELARADAVAWRTPYQSDKFLRKNINLGKTKFFDMHLSALPQNLRYGFLGKVDVAVIEASEVQADGKVILTTSVGATPTLARVAEKVIIELNTSHQESLYGLHDIYEPLDPPMRRPIHLTRCDGRIGTEYVQIDPNKIIGVVASEAPDEIGGFRESDATTMKIGENVATFLASEMRAGRVPTEFLPIQSGVGNIANAVLAALGDNEDIPSFQMYSEVIQDSVIKLMSEDKISFASATSLTLSPEVLQQTYDNYSFFKRRLLLRPQEISNHPEVIRRLGIISINTAIEVDIFGNVNSTHVMGKEMMNGIGGSGDFTRNAFISIFTCPSIAKAGAISAIVPMVSHLDHSEHSVQVLITEQGIADLRAKDPQGRANAIINNCVHPDYREMLWDYFKSMQSGHTPQTLKNAFKMHERFLEHKDMRGATITAG
ncbi:succinate CoA transferase [Pelagicoccus mobilis]|uniref:Succinate CoA transferase n=2 Tax=Pelagicoccus mobilis TaxID=415221 RepID=A0A934S1E9_9BACT|nr:succinate CoA transferase [Pelagicoccus mobilis]